MRMWEPFVTHLTQLAASSAEDHHYNEEVDVTSDNLEPATALNALTADEQAWARHSEALWQRAYALANAHPNVDAGDVYHALRCLELAPTARLRRGLSRGRLRAHAR
ncbi:MAG TPA: hypothetical protein VIX35_11525 [Vicinamibacterales bacterium]